MAEPGIAIRPGRPDDVAIVHRAIVDLARHVGAEDHVESSPDDLARHAFSDRPSIWIEIAEIGGSFAGMCLHFPIYSTWMGRPGVYVQDLFVAEGFRCRKVGESLLRHVARQCRQAGGGYLRLAVEIDNVRAIGFYERLGIRPAEHEQVQRIMGASFIAFCDGGDFLDG